MSLGHLQREAGLEVALERKPEVPLGQPGARRPAERAPRLSPGFHLLLTTLFERFLPPPRLLPLLLLLLLLPLLHLHLLVR